MLSQQLEQQIFARLQQLPGEICFAYADLADGSRLEFNSHIPVVAASVIKLPVLVCAFEQAQRGLLNMEETIILRQEDKLPSCGALKAMHSGLQVTLRDLCVLMIILSDNTATNLVIRRLGMDAVNDCMRRMGLQDSTLRRLLFDSEAAARGLENTVTAGEMLLLLEKMYRGQLLGPDTDRQLLEILKDQRLNGKMPFWLPHGVACAHKTGEDDGITHDVGIVYAPRPFAVCFLGQKTDPPRFEREMQDITALLYQAACEG